MGGHLEKRTVTYTSTGTKPPLPFPETGVRGFQVHGTFSALNIDIEASIFGNVWFQIETGITGAGGFTSFAVWPLYRIKVNTLTGDDVIIDQVVEVPA